MLDCLYLFFGKHHIALLHVKVGSGWLLPAPRSQPMMYHGISCSANQTEHMAVRACKYALPNRDYFCFRICVKSISVSLSLAFLQDFFQQKSTMSRYFTDASTNNESGLAKRLMIWPQIKSLTIDLTRLMHLLASLSLAVTCLSLSLYECHALLCLCRSLHLSVLYLYLLSSSSHLLVFLDSKNVSANSRERKENVSEKRAFQRNTRRSFVLGRRSTTSTIRAADEADGFFPKEKKGGKHRKVGESIDCWTDYGMYLWRRRASSHELVHRVGLHLWC